MKRSYSRKLSKWYSLLALPLLELRPYDSSEKFPFDPKLKNKCTLHSLELSTMVRMLCIHKVYTYSRKYIIIQNSQKMLEYIQHKAIQ